MIMFDDISSGSRGNEKESLSNANLVSPCAKRFGKGQLSFTGPGSVNGIYPAPDIHQHFMIHNGYGTMRTSSRTTSTTLSTLRPIA